MILTRDSIKDGIIQRFFAEAGDTSALSEAELLASRQATLALADPVCDVWVFGYGSLIWNPAFHFAERRVGRVHGYHRRFCLWVHLGRGSSEQPGLMLGLERGGSCEGVALRIPREAAETELEIIWRREMVSGAYRPHWVTVRGDGPALRAIAFVINHHHPRYAGRVPEEVVVETVAAANGPLGACADYLFNTVEHLQELGIRDHALETLRRRVAAAREAGS